MDTNEDQLIDEPTLLKAPLKVRHWQKLNTFAHQWDKVAKTIDSRLADSCPAHAQFYRWLSSSIPSMPHPDACRILEAMFPGWTVQQLFRPVRTSRNMLQPTPTAKPDNNENVATLAQRLRDQGTGSEDAWTETGNVQSKISCLSLLRDSGNLASSDALGTPKSEIDKNDNGHAVVEYDRLILDLMNRPPSSLSWDIWFKYAYEKVAITANSELLSCSATEELPDGSERSAMEGLTWDTSDGYHTVRVSRDHLERNQAITISWELDR